MCSIVSVAPLRVACANCSWSTTQSWRVRMRAHQWLCIITSSLSLQSLVCLPLDKYLTVWIGVLLSCQLVPDHCVSCARRVRIICVCLAIKSDISAISVVDCGGVFWANFNIYISYTDLQFGPASAIHASEFVDNETLHIWLYVQSKPWLRLDPPHYGISLRGCSKSVESLPSAQQLVRYMCLISSLGVSFADLTLHVHQGYQIRCAWYVDGR